MTNDPIEPCFWVDTSANPMGQQCDGENALLWKYPPGVHRCCCLKCHAAGPGRKTREQAIRDYNRHSKFLDRVRFTVWEER